VKNQFKVWVLPAVLLAGLTALGWNGSALAAGTGHGGGGGSHVGGGGHFGGFAGRGGYGNHGGYRGGYGGHGGYGGWGWGGLGLGLYFATLPFYYSTLWADGVPYYYADDNYYQWDSNVGEYQTVNPPVDIQRQAEMQSSNLIAYPKNGQSAEQQATDKSECSAWAVSQSGFDPTPVATTPGTTTGPTSKRSDYMRAQAACLEGRGYSVK
jgi:hypothetical protein